MNVTEFKKNLESHGDKYRHFKTFVKDPMSNRPDIHALMLLDTLVFVPVGIEEDDDEDSMSHTILINIEELAEKVNERQIMELAVCGVFFHENDGSLRILYPFI